MINLPFEASFDPIADSIYIKIKEGKYNHSKEKDNLVFDYDKNGNLIGIEILDISQNENILKDLIFSGKLSNEIYIN